MNIKRALLFLLFCYANGLHATVFEIGKPLLPAQKHWYPWNAFFNSLYALKEIDTGKYPVRAEIGGYISEDLFWDTRQVDSVFEGLFLFVPKAPLCDPLGQDINAVGQCNMVVMQTRGRAKLFGPEILGAESFGYLEVDFLGSSVVAARMRCRIAEVTLTWKEAQAYILAGLFYHPMRLSHLDLDPKVISRNYGAPLHPVVRAPQFKIGKAWKNKLHLECIAMGAFDATDFITDAGVLIFDDAPFQNAMTPMMDIRLWLGEDDTRHLIGIGFDIRRIMPRLVTEECVRTRTTLTSISLDAYAKVTAEPLSIRTQFIWAQNASYLNMIGGYVVKCIDAATDKRTYTNLDTLSYWIDFNLDKKISPGLFGGYTVILPHQSPIIPSITDPISGEKEATLFMREQNIKYVARLAPRIRFNVKPFVFGTELEWTRAGYGTMQSSGHITNVRPVNNLRFILTSYYFF